MNKILKGVLVAAAVISMLGLSAPTNPPPMLDEDDMVSDDDTCTATQQSIKKYVDDNLGEWTKISTQTASASATIDFTTLSGTYRDFKVVISDVVPATDAVSLYVRASVASTFKSGASDYGWAYSHIGSDGVEGNSGDSADSEWIASGTMGSAAQESGSMTVILFNPASTANRAKIIVDGFQDSDDSVLRRFIVSGRAVGTIGASAVDGIRFLFSSGNIESGTFTLYGRSN